jgi:hypothetical protein
VSIVHGRDPPRRHAGDLGLSTYVVPKIDVQVAAKFSSRPGPPLAANYAAPNAVVAPSLGRNLSGNLVCHRQPDRPRFDVW